MLRSFQLLLLASAVFVLFSIHARVAGAELVCPSTKDAEAAIEPSYRTLPFDPVGAVNGKFEVSATGSATYTIPIVVPPGRRGMQPALSLAYDSNAGESSAGVGFSLRGISSISRCGRTPAKDVIRHGVVFEERDPFCLDGARLVEVATLADGSREFRTFPDQFKRVIARYSEKWDPKRGPSHFEVWDDNGRIRRFGWSGNSRVLVASGAVASWWISEERDRRDNTIVYSYTNDLDAASGHTFRFNLKEISYSAAPGLAATRRVTFELENWTTTPRFVGGGYILDDRRIRRIKTWVFEGKAWTLARLYKLAYQKSGATGRALLREVRECLGEDDALCKPPTRFGWMLDKPGYAPPALVGNHPEPWWVVAADVSGDGLDDIVYVYGELPYRLDVQRNLGGAQYGPRTTWGYHMLLNPSRPQIIDSNADGRMDLVIKSSTGALHQFEARADHSFAPGEDVSWWNATQRFHVADFYGNGKPSIAQCFSKSECLPDGTCGVLTGWTYQLPTPGFDCDDDVHFVDLNGDGTVDPLGPADLMPSLCLNPPCNYFAADKDPAAPGANFGGWVMRDTGLPHEGMSGKTIFVDVNGDRLADAIQGRDETLTTYLNDGKGFRLAGPTLTSTPPVNSFAVDHFLGDAKVIDYEADGDSDLLMPIDDCDALAGIACWYLLRSNGDGSFDVIDVGLGPKGDVLVTDANGDGRHDILTEDDGTIELRLSGGPSDLLGTITDGLNALDPGDPGFLPNVSIDYGALIDTVEQQGHLPGSFEEDAALYSARWSYQQNPCTEDHACVVGNLRVVRAYVLNNGANGARKFELGYRNGRQQGDDRGWLGFGAKIVRDVEARSTSVELYDNFTFDATHGVYSSGQPYASWNITTALPGQPNGSEIDIEYTSTGWQRIATNGGATYFVSPVAHTKKRRSGSYVPGSQPLFQFVANESGNGTTLISQTARQLADVDQYGNVGDEQEVNGGLETKVTLRTFDLVPEKWLIRQLDREQICSTAAGLTQCSAREVDYDVYGDEIGFWRGEPGDPSTELSGASVRDQFGNVIRSHIEDASGERRASCTTFDNQGIFPIAQGNALGHFRYARVDQRLGKSVAELDPNGLLKRSYFDGFGRLQVLLEADGTWQTFERTRTKNGGPQANWWTVRVHNYTSAGKQRTLEHDMLGRVVKNSAQGSSVQACDGNYCTLAPVYSEITEFDALGRVHRRSETYLNGSPAPLRYTTYRYDALGRRVEETTPWGATIKRSFTGNQATVIDSAGTSYVVVDALGRVDTVIDELGTKTQFAYGPFGHLRSVTNAGLVTSYETDALGRITKRTDPDRGVTHSVYNGFGELVLESDALGRQIGHKYDLLGRKLERTAPDGVEKWFYDPVGCLGCTDKVASADGVVTYFGHDAFGRVNSTRIRVDSKDLELLTDHDDQGRIHQVTYPRPDGQTAFRVRYDYDASGRISKVSNASSGAVYWQLHTLDAGARIHKESFGNGTITTRDWDHAKNRVKRIRTLRQTTPLQDWRYDYDDRLNPAWRKDGVMGRTEFFDYDALDRLGCVKEKDASPTCLLELKYAPNGNITYKSDVGGYQYSSAQPHAVVSAGSDAFAYDDVGNQIARPGVTIDYTSFDLPRSYTRASGTTTFTYDAAQRRVKRATNVSNTLYFPDFYERISLGLLGVRHRYHVPLGQARLVVERASGVAEKRSYVHPDALGSTDVITDAAGQVIDRRSYDAFGARRTPDGSPAPADWVSSYTTVGYTGHDADDDVDLIDTKGRIYDPRVARFLQTDPLITNTRSSQRWNPYSYAMNGPLRYTDPSGYDPEPVGSSGASDVSGGSYFESDAMGRSIVGPDTVDPSTGFQAVNVSIFGPKGDETEREVEKIEDPPPEDPEDIGGGRGIGAALDYLTDSLVDYARGASSWVGDQAPAMADLWVSQQMAGGAIVAGGIVLAGAALTPIQTLGTVVTTGELLNGSGVCSVCDFGDALTDPGEPAPYQLSLPGKTQGHHIPGQAAFEGHPNYHPRRVATLSNEMMERLGVKHTNITTVQQRLYRAFARTGQPLTWEDMARIETEALVNGGISGPIDRDLAERIVNDAIWRHHDLGVDGATRVPNPPRH